MKPQNAISIIGTGGAVKAVVNDAMSDNLSATGTTFRAIDGVLSDVVAGKLGQAIGPVIARKVGANDIFPLDEIITEVAGAATAPTVGELVDSASDEAEEEAGDGFLYGPPGFFPNDFTGGEFGSKFDMKRTSEFCYGATTVPCQ